MSSTIIADLNSVSLHINRYLSITLFLFGSIGNILSCLVFSHRKLRSSPCVLYFLMASLFNLISLIDGIPPRTLRDWNILPDQTETNSLLCKLRLTVLFVTRNAASWLLLCGTIDRYLVSSKNANWRRMSNFKQAVRCTVVVCVLSVLLWSEAIYCFEANMLTTPVKCYAKSDACRIINDLSQALITTVVPSLLMLAFGLATIRNIRRSHMVLPVTLVVNTNNQTRTRKTDASLTRMLFLQVILLTIFNVPQAIQKFYLTYTFYQPKSPVQKAWESLFFAIALLLTYVPNCLPFYLYTFTGSVFRKVLLEMMSTMVRRLACRRP